MPEEYHSPDHRLAERPPSRGVFDSVKDSSRNASASLTKSEMLNDRRDLERIRAQLLPRKGESDEDWTRRITTDAQRNFRERDAARKAQLLSDETGEVRHQAVPTNRTEQERLGHGGSVLRKSLLTFKQFFRDRPEETNVQVTQEMLDEVSGAIMLLPPYAPTPLKGSELKEVKAYLQSKQDVLSAAMKDPQLQSDAVTHMELLFKAWNCEEVQKSTLSTIERNIPLLQKALEDPARSSELPSILKTIHLLTLYGSEEQQKGSLHLLDRFIADAPPGSLRDVKPIVRSLLFTGSQSAFHFLRRELEEEENTHFAVKEYIGAMIGSSDRTIAGEGHSILSWALTDSLGSHYSEGLQSRLLNAWKMASIVTKGDGSGITNRYIVNAHLAEKIEENLNVIDDLAETAKDAATTLEAEFGIRDFSRYPSELLLTQYEERNRDLEYITVITARGDHNGIFDDSYAIINLLSKLKRNYTIRLVECGTKIELLGRLHELDKRYGNKHKIGGIVLRAHGETDSIHLGREAGTLQGKDILEHASDAVRDLLAPEAPIAFISCDTGKEGGIAEITAGVFEGNVSAPDTSTNVSTIEPIFQDTRLVQLKPRFYKGHTMAYQKTGGRNRRNT